MILNAISKIYGSAVRQRNTKFDAGYYKVFDSKVPVISVGNISVGGTGKTPFVIMLAKELFNMGHYPAIVGKGYKRKSKGEIVVSDGNTINDDITVCGDEMLLLAESLKAPVIVHDKKYLAAQSAEKKFNIDSIIVDDGFQHRQLHRDLDIVLMDRATIDNPKLIPAGRLREPYESLYRADVICLLGDVKTEELIKRIDITKKIIIHAVVKSEKPYNILEQNSFESVSLKVNQKNIIAVSAIAKPSAFSNMLSNMDFTIIKQIIFRDHHWYSKKDILKIINLCKKNNCSAVATTEKDAVKLKLFIDLIKNTDIDFYVFPISLEIIKGMNEFRTKIKSFFIKKT